MHYQVIKNEAIRPTGCALHDREFWAFGRGEVSEN